MMGRVNKTGKRLIAFISTLLLITGMLAGCGDIAGHTGISDNTQLVSVEDTAVTEVLEANIIEESEITELTQTAETETDQINSEQKPAGDLTVHFMDVGQGDATLISCDGHFMLIDAGNNDKGTLVQNYLQKQGVTTLDYVIGTHTDADHIGGLDVAIYKFDCQMVMMPDVTNDTRTYEDVIDVMKNKNYKTTYPVVGQTYSLGTATFTIIAPNKDYGSSLNDCSVGILLQNGENRFLFTGDAEEKAEADILANGIDISADVYKVAHHGSDTATTEAFLKAVNPTYAVISAGEGNSYGHPHAEVLNRLRETGVQVFRTDEQGTIVVKSDGTDITWNCSPSETWQSGERKGSSTNEDAAAGGVSAASAVKAADGSGDVIVHITDTGMKYHSAGCRYLKSSDIEVTLSTAKSQGLTPCSVCNPPQ